MYSVCIYIVCIYMHSTCIHLISFQRRCASKSYYGYVEMAAAGELLVENLFKGHKSGALPEDGEQQTSLETLEVTPYTNPSRPSLLFGSERTAQHNRPLKFCARRKSTRLILMHTNTSTTPSGFDRFGLHKSLRRGILAAGFEAPREIQHETIPAGRDGRDVLGLAQTGTGKTAAFALPLLDRILKNPGKGPRALVLAPTRELAAQIAIEIDTLAKFTRLRVVTIFGGVPTWKQIQALRQKRPEIIVGCPGRVLDLYTQRELNLDNIDVLVIDEADHMFDMGFLPDIRRILHALPSRRQNLLFSATMPNQIRALAEDILNNPHVVKLADSAPADTIDHALYPVEETRKRDLLQHLLNQDGCDSAIVFTRTKHRARRLADQLNRAGHRAVGLQGNMSQSQRDRAMRGFRSRRFDILVATDIAARGIDVAGVTHVINFDVPGTPEAYTHRIGRTGRSEQAGVACTFVTAKDRAWVRDTEKMIGEPIMRENVEGFDVDFDLKPERRERPQEGSAGRSRKSPQRGRYGKNRGRNGSSRNYSGNGGYSNGGSGRDSGNSGRRRRRSRRAA